MLAVERGEKCILRELIYNASRVLLRDNISTSYTPRCALTSAS